MSYILQTLIIMREVMEVNDQISLANKFQLMHKDNDMLIIPNVWDVGSAVVFEKIGFKAIATTSAGISYSLGYPDGEHIGISELELITSLIAKRISIPLSIDFERGYGNDLKTIKSNAKRIIEAGAVGLNIEDGYCEDNKFLEDLSFQKEKINSLVELRNEIGIPFVINARTCVYWLNLYDDTKRLDVAIERGKQFQEAGADCFFVPGALSEDEIRIIASEVDIPINIVANPKITNLNKIKELGAGRYSIGSGAVRKIYSKLIDLGNDLKHGDISSMLDNNFSYKKANDFFK